MRKSKLEEDEVLKAEKAKDDRKQSRSLGFSKMRERDQKHARIRDLKQGKEVWLHWGFNNKDFMLEIKGGHTIVVDAEEFRRWLRWV